MVRAPVKLIATFRSYRWLFFFAGVLAVSSAHLAAAMPHVAPGYSNLNWLALIFIGYSLEGLASECCGVRVYEDHLTIPRRFAAVPAVFSFGRRAMSFEELISISFKNSGVYGLKLRIHTNIPGDATKIIALIDDRRTIELQKLLKDSAPNLYHYYHLNQSATALESV
jgi:hypothetical protein